MLLLSVIVPVYNGERYIKQCVTLIEELNNEIYTLFEIIIVDDGSTDNSLSIIRSLLFQFDNIVVLHKSNGGIASSRNMGLLKAKGKYIAFCDQDDSLVKGYGPFIQKMEDANCDLLISNYYVGGGANIFFLLVKFIYEIRLILLLNHFSFF